MTHTQVVSSNARPLFRWIGGKQRLAKSLAPRLLRFVRDRHYVEPFLGAASFFFELKPEKALLSDHNRTLINCYRWIKVAPGNVWRSLLKHIEADSYQHYYATRTTFNALPD